MTELIMTGDIIVMAVIVILITTLLLIAIKVLSNSRSRDIISDTPSIITSSSSSSSGSWKYDVFLSFRGEDTRKTFVDHLYSALQRHGILTYKDDVTLDRGDTIGPSLLEAIQQSHIALIVFSENYADSSWCLDELSYIMKCKEERGQIVMPVFYHVDPSDVRKQKGRFGKAFAKHNKKKVKSWKKALVDASNIAGWELTQVADRHEAKFIQEIVGSILDKLLSSNSNVDNEDLVGMGSRLKQLKSQLGMESGGVRMVGIWGLGGGGKTTFATSLYMQISPNFDGCCLLGNIREESNKYGLAKLQEKILFAVFSKETRVESVELGKDKIRDMLSRRKVLIVLDDVDHLDQLEALAGSSKWFGDGSRIIITTRDEHLLTTHRVKYVSHVTLLSDNEAIRLFKRRAYNENNPVRDYEMLAQQIVSYSGGLPLALVVLGSFLYGKDNDEWIGTLSRLKDHPEMDILGKLRISYDGLKPVEKELFLDIACFHRGVDKDEAMEILDACGFHPAIGLKVLKQKALITVSKDGEFDMHDLVQEMAHHIVRGEHPNNPEKHSRLWQTQDIEDICSRNATQENDKIEAMQLKSYDGSSNFVMLVSNMNKLRFLNLWECSVASPFPESFQGKKLVVLKIHRSLQKTLWKGYKHLPCLKELELCEMDFLVRTPDFGGVTCLQKLKLWKCESLEEIHPSLGKHLSLIYVEVRSCWKLKRFPSIVGMEKLEILMIEYCLALTQFPKIEAKMDNLVELSLKHNGTEPSLVTNLVRWCGKLKSLEGKFLQALRKLNLSGCELKDGDIQRFQVGELSNLQELHLTYNDFTRLDSSLSRLTRLKLLDLSDCKNLVQLPRLPSSLAILKADFCESLESIIRDEIHKNCKCLSQVSITGGIWENKDIKGGERLLETMLLQGNGGVESRCMSLQVSGSDMARGFEPRSVRGERCKMQLPKNWFNEFSGFLICTASDEFPSYDREMKISMKHVEEEDDNGGWMGMGDSQHDDNDGKKTWVGYIPFSLLRHTLWWDPTSTAIQIQIQIQMQSINNDDYINSYYGVIRECGLKLVLKKSQTETTSSEISPHNNNDDYKCKFDIGHDSKSALECIFDLT